MTVKSDCPVMLGLWGSSGPSGLSKVQFHHRWAAQVHAWASAWEPRVWAGPAVLENPLSHSPLPPELPLRAPPECSRSLLLEPQSHCDNLVTFISRADALDIGRFSHHSFSTMNGRGGVSVSCSIACSCIPSRPPVGILLSIQETAALPSRLHGQLQANVV